MHTVQQIGTQAAEARPKPSLPWTAIDKSRVAQRASAVLTTQPRPIVRWAGSKQRLLSQLVEYLPTGYRTYYEPFLGAGSMYFLLQPAHAVLNDACAPLVDMYNTVADDADAVLARLEVMDVLDRDFYYEMRRSEPSDPTDAAARFLYLNRAGWNGLYRVNKKGQFNVPYGKPRSPNIVEATNFRAAASLLASPSTQIVNGDFEDATRTVSAGDLVFLDPPYASSRRRESFVDYNENLFSWDDQVRLARHAEALRQTGAHVIVTNAHNSAIRALYPSFSEHGLVRRSSLAGDVSRRRPVAESVLVS